MDLDAGQGNQTRSTEHRLAHALPTCPTKPATKMVRTIDDGVVGAAAQIPLLRKATDRSRPDLIEKCWVNGSAANQPCK